MRLKNQISGTLCSQIKTYYNTHFQYKPKQYQLPKKSTFATNTKRKKSEEKDLLHLIES